MRGEPDTFGGPRLSPNTPRKGDWIQTFSGGQFWPLDPRADEIFLIDLAAALGNECRYSGHCLRFYSVSEHSVLMYRAAKRRAVHDERFRSPRLLRAVLFHDGSEGLGLRDMARPIKGDLTNYKALETGVMVTVAERFAFDWPLHPAVKELDEAIGLAERMQNMAPAPVEWDVRFDAHAPLDVTLEYWPPHRAMVEFLIAAGELGLR